MDKITKIAQIKIKAVELEETFQLVERIETVSTLKTKNKAETTLKAPVVDDIQII